MSTILVTGGAGYIGSHTVLELLTAGHRVVVVDNLDNSSLESIRRVEALVGKRVDVHLLDLLDRAGLDLIFAKYRIDAVIHFAGLKAVGESTQQPLRYYHNNLTSTLHLLEAMKKAGCKTLVFSSSATVYGDPERLPIIEDQALRTTNPYGATKLWIEGITADLAKAEPGWNLVMLRYFNPVGAHESGRIGEDPAGIPNNLMPFIMQVAVGRREVLSVYGNDWPTPDGTGVRDYIHVVDLAQGHVAAIDKALGGALPGWTAINLGTGNGQSVLDMVKGASKAVGRELPYRFSPRRPGDIAACYCDPAKAQRLLGWKANLGVDRMCADHWRWQKNNPQGYAQE